MALSPPQGPHVELPLPCRQLCRSGCLIHNGTYLTLSLTLTIMLTLLTLTVTVRVTLTLILDWFPVPVMNGRVFEIVVELLN